MANRQSFGIEIEDPIRHDHGFFSLAHTLIVSSQLSRPNNRRPQSSSWSTSPIYMIRKPSANPSPKPSSSSVLIPLSSRWSARRFGTFKNTLLPLVGRSQQQRYQCYEHAYRAHAHSRSTCEEYLLSAVIQDWSSWRPDVSYGLSCSFKVTASQWKFDGFLFDPRVPCLCLNPSRSIQLFCERTHLCVPPQHLNIEWKCSLKVFDNLSGSFFRNYD